MLWRGPERWRLKQSARLVMLRGSAEYRRYMSETLARQALEMLAEGTESDTLPPKPVMLWAAATAFPPSQR